MGAVLRLNPRRATRELVKRTAAVVRRGGTILYPTDTIYGLGCDALREDAVERIFRIKRRPLGNPALALVDDISMVKGLVREIPLTARRLIRCFWPGPLTIIFDARNLIHPFITKDGKIALRLPRNNFCLKLIAECRVPILSTSANISGQEAPKDIQSLKQLFQDQVDLVVDAGNMKSIVPSTIVDVSSGKVAIVREGAISARRVGLCLGLKAWKSIQK